MNCSRLQQIVFFGFCFVILGNTGAWGVEQRVPQKISTSVPYCLQDLSKLRADVRELTALVNSYEKSGTEARNAYLSIKPEIRPKLVKHNADAGAVRAKVEQIRQGWARLNGTCPANNLDRSAKNELIGLASDTKRTAIYMDGIKCVLCGQRKIMPPAFKQITQAAGSTIGDCFQKVSPPNGCNDQNVQACKACCEAVKPQAGSINMPPDQCKQQCVMKQIVCEQSACGNTSSCPTLVNNTTCDIQDCQACCSKNCPSGIDGCDAHCLYKQSLCILKSIAERQSKNISSMTGK